MEQLDIGCHPQELSLTQEMGRYTKMNVGTAGISVLQLLQRETCQSDIARGTR